MFKTEMIDSYHTLIELSNNFTASHGHLLKT